MSLICADCKNNIQHYCNAIVLFATCNTCNIQYSLDNFGLLIYFNYQANCNINYNNLSYNKSFQDINQNDFQNIINLGFKYYKNSIFE